MKTSQLKTILIIILFVVLLSACGKTSEPELTATPEPTSTPVPPTPTPSPEDILAEAWQAYEDEDYETASSIAEDVRDQTKTAGDESGEALALIGLIQMASGASGAAEYNLEEAMELGYENEVLTDALVKLYIEQIDERITDLYTLFNPDTILSEIFHAQEALAKLEAIAPDDPKTKEFSAMLNPEKFNPADYVEADLTLGEIENLLTRLDSGDPLNFTSSYFSDLKEAHPQNPLTLYFYAVQMLVEDEYEDAIDSLISSTEIEPGNHSTWDYLGFTYYNVGMVMHARDAYINCLILNPDNESAYENLASIGDWRESWTDRGFEGLDFSIQHIQYETFSKIGDTSKSAGMIQSENNNLEVFTQITWMPDGGDPSFEHLQEQMVAAIDAASPGFKTKFKSYPYGPVPMVYRNYAYRLPDSSTYADAVIVGAQCSGTNIIFDYRSTVDGKDHEWLHYILTIYLETFSCSD